MDKPNPALLCVRARTQRAVFALAIAFAAVALVLAAATPAHAEGSKELVAHGGYRPYTERYNASTAGESRLTEIYAYVKEGETVSFGTSVKDAVAGFTNEKMGTNLSDDELAALDQCDVVVCDPDWVREQDDRPGSGNAHAYPYFQGARDERVSTYDVSGTATADGGDPGYIGSYARESAGPSGVANGGYAPFKFTASKSGVYLFKFYSQSLSNRNPRPALFNDDAAFTSAAQAGSTVAAWDVTVSDGSGPQTGRVFATRLFLNMGNNFNKAGVLMSHMFAVTDDNYHYEIDFNGMDPFGFLFFANNRGMLEPASDGSTQSLYHSVRSMNNALSDLAEHGVVLNNIPTSDLDSTYKLFFNNPTDPDVLAALGIATQTGSNAIENFAFSGNPSPNPAAPALGSNEGYVGKGGRFSFDAGRDVAATSYEITLNFGAGNTVTLSNSLVKGGTNVIEWDGRDANGVPVPAGTYDLNNVSVKLKGGEVHFPLLDVENNFDGVKIHRLAQDGSVEDSTVYYNNSASNAGDTTSPWSMSNWVVADQQDHSVGGVDSSAQGAMAYRSFVGDQTALDIWAYHDLPVVLQPFRFALKDVPTRVTVHKTWDHGANNGQRPGEIAVELLVDGQSTGDPAFTQTLVATPGSADGGTYTWENLDPSKTYTVRELNVPENYQPSESIVGDNDEGWSIELTNAYIGEADRIEIHKDWSGTPAPDQLEVDLVGRDRNDVEQYRAHFVLDEGNGWFASVEQLSDDERKLWFHLEERLPEGYRQVSQTNTVAPDGNGAPTLFFSLANEKTVDLTVTKTWDDDGNARGLRPQSVQLQLLKDGQPFGDPVSVGEGDAWTHTWHALADDGSGYEAFAVYETEGSPSYRSSAGSPDDAAAFPNGSAVIANTLVTTTQFTVQKTWVNDSDAPFPQASTCSCSRTGSPTASPIP